MGTDYTDPSTVDVDVVIGNINHAHRMRGHTWTDERSWPNVTVKALADEVELQRLTVRALRRELEAKALRALVDGQPTDVLRGLLDHAVQSWSPRGTDRAPLLAEWDDTDWADSGWTDAERVELRAAIERSAAEPDEEPTDAE